MEFSTFIDNTEKIATILAIIGGGVWAYFNFFNGRVYHLRLEPAISGKIFQQKGAFYLLATARVKNVGLSQVTIEAKGTGLRILAFNPLSASGEEEDSWKHISTVPVFMEHQWIESKEEIESPHLQKVPIPVAVAYKLEVRIVSQKLSWAASTIVEVALECP